MHVWLHLKSVDPRGGKRGSHTKSEIQNAVLSLREKTGALAITGKCSCLHGMAKKHKETQRQQSKRGGANNQQQDNQNNKTNITHDIKRQHDRKPTKQTEASGEVLEAKKEIILMIDEIHTLVGAGGTGALPTRPLVV